MCNLRNLKQLSGKVGKENVRDQTAQLHKVQTHSKMHWVQFTWSFENSRMNFFLNSPLTERLWASRKRTARCWNKLIQLKNKKYINYLYLSFEWKVTYSLEDLKKITNIWAFRVMAPQKKKTWFIVFCREKYNLGIECFFCLIKKKIQIIYYKQFRMLW